MVDFWRGGMWEGKVPTVEGQILGFFSELVH